MGRLVFYAEHRQILEFIAEKAETGKVKICKGLLIILCLAAPADAAAAKGCGPGYQALGRSASARVVVHGLRGQEQAVKEAIAQVERNLGRLRAPRNLTVSYTDDSAASGRYLPDSQEILFPPALARDFRSEARETLLQHEFGHGVFYENLGDFSPEWKRWQESLSRRAGSPLISGSAPEFVPHPGIIEQISFPYQELFADLLTVVSRRDPEAISRVIKEDFAITGPRADSRSFLGPALNPAQAVSEKHQQLAPVRRFLWHKYLSKPENKNRGPEIINEAFAIIAREVVERSQAPALHQISPASANERLLERLRAGLARFE